MQILAKRLKELRESRRIYQKEMAEHLGLSFRGYQDYENDKSEPKLKTLIAIADYFQVSIDYLVGRTDAPGVNRGDAED